MKNTLLRTFVSVALLLAATAARSQYAYSNAVMSLAPAGYWPMHEVEPMAQGDIETNYGTLGLLGTGYYPDWVSGNGLGIKRGAPGALGNDPDQSVFFTREYISAARAIPIYTNDLAIPHSSPLTTLNPPFTVECWIEPTNTTAGQGVFGQFGFEGLNAGEADLGMGNYCGLYVDTLATSGGLGVYGEYNGVQTEITSSSLQETDVWTYVVVTCDANTNFTLYTNGVPTTGGAVPGVGKYTPDYWTPLTIGNCRGYSRAFVGSIDEFAVYTNVISDISTHYSDGISGGLGAYFHDVTNDNPVIYLRMDAPAGAYSPPAAGTWPVLNNLGTTNGLAVGGGVYTPGTIPGVVTTPMVNPNGVPFKGVSNLFAALSGVSSFGDAGYAAAYNPTGSNAFFSVTALFRGDPCENRVESIVSHGISSWQLSLNTNGFIVFNNGDGQQASGGTGQAAGDVKTMGVYNDGFWHQVVVVNTTNFISIYVDGALDTNATPSGITATNGIPGNGNDVMIGADPTFTNNPVGVGRQFAGQICDAAFFTNALTINQIQTLYSNCEVAPFITGQPTNATLNAGTSLTDPVIAKGSARLSYQWFTNGVAFSGQTNSSLTLSPALAADTSTNDYVVVMNNYGSITSAVFSLTIYGPPIFLSQFPVTYSNVLNTSYLTLYAGANPSFSVTTAGAPPISYQWYSNSVALAGQTNTSLTLTNAQIGSLTNYCVASNFVGVTTSTVWAASVIADPVGAGDVGLAPYPQTVLALNPIAYWRLNEGNDDENGDDGYVAIDYASGNDGLYTNAYLGQTGYNPTTDPSDTSVEFDEFSGGNNFAGQIEGIDFATANGSNAEFTVQAWAKGSVVNQVTGGAVIAQGKYGVSDAFNLGMDSAAAHNYRFYVRNAAGTVFTADSTFAPDGNWHNLVGVCDEANGVVSLYIDGNLVATNPIATASGLYEASAPISIGAGTSDGVNYANQFNGYLNDVALYRSALTASNVAAQYVSTGVPPSFTQPPPATEAVNAGGILTIPTTAIGTPDLTNWWVDVGSNAVVATGLTNGVVLNATLTVSNVPAKWNNDELELIVSNAYGMTNFYITLTVFTNAPQIITNLPPQVAAVSGNPYTYSITVVGPAPYAYQWYNGAVPLANQTNSTYSLMAGSPGSTTYYVVITNVYGATTSTVSTFTSVAQLTNPYETNLLQFRPVAYWPLQETNPPSPAMIETNFGLLGALGNAYYAATNPSDVVFDQPGALAGNTDPSVDFTASADKTPDSFAFVPRVSPALTLKPPFTLELWINGPMPSSLSSENTEDLLSEEGSGLNSPANTGNFGGFRLAWVYGPAFALLPASGNGTSIGDWSWPVTAANQWYHFVVSYDGTNFYAYIDGALEGTEPFTMAPDNWTPLTIGAGRWQGGTDTRAFNGYMNDVAVYTNVLSASDITNHWLAGTTAGSNYMQTVMNDRPLLYYHMDRQSYYTNPTPQLDPIAVNYGLDSVNGFYRSGTVPGELSGPPIAGLNNTCAPLINGMISCINVGYDPTLNPTGTQPFTAMTWFKCNPSDGQTQTLMSHGGKTSWSLNIIGTNGLVSWNSGAGSVASTNILNDGDWHFAVGVYDGTNNYLYVDGALNNSSAASGSIVGNTTDNIFLGGDPDFTQVSGAGDQYFAGTLAQMAFFTNALTAVQISQIYNASVIPVTVNPYPTNIVFAVTNNQLTLSWPADHTGWQLQAQTNSLLVGISTNWVNVSNSTTTNQVAIPINLTNGSVFYRLMYIP